MNINRREIRRYLGMSPHAPAEEETEALIGECLIMLEQAAVPRSVYKRFPLSWRNGFPVINDETVESRHLARNLDGCREVIIMAATLGAGVDRLIQKQQLLSMSKAAVLQACAAAMIEAVCDDVNENIRKEALEEGLHAHPRYSPGYGDLPLQFQKTVFSLIRLPKEIGLTLNDSLLMSPAKSVTALIGLSEEPCPETDQSCETCAMSQSCSFRREEI